VVSFRSSLETCGMRVERTADISANILEAMKEHGGRRLAMFQQSLPPLFVRWFQEFAGNADSVVYRRFTQKTVYYFSCVLRKAARPGPRAPSPGAPGARTAWGGT
jgi:hypothetical protein